MKTLRFLLLGIIAFIICGCTEILVVPAVLNVYVPEGSVMVRYYMQQSLGNNKFKAVENTVEVQQTEGVEEILGEYLHALYGKLPADAEGEYMYFKRTAGSGRYYVIGGGNIYINQSDWKNGKSSSLSNIQRAYEAGEFPYSCIDVLEELAKQCPKAVVVIDDDQEHQVQEGGCWKLSHFTPSITLPLADDIIIP